MKNKFLRIALTILSLFGILYILFVITFWAINGGIPGFGPTGDLLPIHIYGVSPKDGETVTIRSQPKGIKGYCVDFNLLAGNGLYDKLKDIHFYMDGIDVTSKQNGIITLDFPPSLANLCSGSEKPLYPGWYTAKVIYKDNLNNSFHYTWRFLVKK